MLFSFKQRFKSVVCYVWFGLSLFSHIISRGCLLPTEVNVPDCDKNPNIHQSVFLHQRGLPEYKTKSRTSDQVGSERLPTQWGLLSHPSPPLSDWVPLECPLPIWVYISYSYTSHSVFPWSPTYLHTGPVQQRECGRSSSHIGLGSRQTTQDMHMQDGKHKIRSSGTQNKVIKIRNKKHMMVRIFN